VFFSTLDGLPPRRPTENPAETPFIIIYALRSAVCRFVVLWFISSIFLSQTGVTERAAE
jgi:hypothetical protein